MTEPGTDPVRPSVETLTAQLYGTVALLFGALVRETELTAALRKIEAERDDYKRLAEIADTLARECRIHESRAEGAEADNARLREGIQSLEGPLWRLILRDENCIDAPCDDQNCQCRSKFDRIYKQARAALTGNVTVGGGRVDWGDQPVAAPTGKADT
jgi:hypothetical protein